VFSMADIFQEIFLCVRGVFCTEVFGGGGGSILRGLFSAVGDFSWDKLHHFCPFLVGKVSSLYLLGMRPYKRNITEHKIPSVISLF
jgi:hypothetical protein